MNSNNKAEVIYLYGHYYISNNDEYLMIDMWNKKVRRIDEDCYNMIALLIEIKDDLKKI